ARVPYRLRRIAKECLCPTPGIVCRRRTAVAMGEQRFLVEAADVERRGDPARSHDQYAIAEANQFRHVGGGDDHRCAGFAQFANACVDVESGPPDAPPRWFVEQQELRPPANRTREDPLLLITAAELAAALAGTAGAQANLAAARQRKRPLTAAREQRTAKA